MNNLGKGIAAIAVSLSMASVANSGSGLEKLKEAYKRPEKIPYPADNPWTQAKEDLGKRLFFEPRMSKSGTQSCATCHSPSFGWEDGMPKAVGHGHKVLGRKTPTVLNLAWAPRLFWDGRAGSLEEQALGPIEAAGEMNMPLEKVVKKLESINGYDQLFEKAFGDKKITKEKIGQAIATYERTIVSAEAPFDRWLAGDHKAISKSAVRGFEVFNNKGKCASCHAGWAFTDHSFQDIGIDDKDLGRGNILKLASMQHAFKTPGLRNISQRGPYMHNGQENTLAEVVEFYNRGGDVERPSKSKDVTKLNLTKQEKKDLVEFMLTLTSEDKPVELPVLSVNF